MSREWRPDWPCPVGDVLRQQRRGAGDPTHRADDQGDVWRAMRTPLGPATLRVSHRPGSDRVHAQAWGAGAEWALATLPSLLGADDDPSGFEAHHDAVRMGLRLRPHWRLGATRLVMESLVPSILEQKVTGKQAFGSFRQLVRLHGEPAPGPVAHLRLMLQPTPATIAAIPSWEWLKLQVEPSQSRALVTACQRASSIERLAAQGPDELDRGLRSLPGIGVWTSAEVRMRALGDPDAVSFGDYHLAHHVGWAIHGHDITDEQMADLLAPYRPQRGRAAAMAIVGGQSRPRRGPRMSVPTHLPTR
jgi:3-methyladenine DNA glycosylase/8-oxoguanine DNA glycosylase